MFQILENKIASKILSVLIFFMIASAYYYFAEGWNLINCVYFITGTVATVGYGDVHPTSDHTRLFTVFVIFFGLIFILEIGNDFAHYVLLYAEQQSIVIQNRIDSLDIEEDPYKYVKKRAYSLLSILLLVIVGSLFLWHNEKWSFIKALYWCVSTITAVGYGDLILQHDSSKLFLIFYIPISVCIVAGALGNLAAIQFEIIAEQKKLECLRRKLDFNMIKEMDLDGLGVDKCEFLIAMLVTTGVCNKHKDIDPWLKRFEELDVDASGRLGGNDIKKMEQEEEERLAAVEVKMLSSKSGRFGSRRFSISVSTPSSCEREALIHSYSVAKTNYDSNC